MIPIPQGFDVQAPEPVEAKGLQDSLNTRDAIAPNIRYEGLKVYVKETALNYQLVGGVDNMYWTPYSADAGVYYTQINLQTSGQALVHWDNITDAKPFELYQPDGTNPFVYTDNTGVLNVVGSITVGGVDYSEHINKLYQPDGTNPFVYTDNGVALHIDGDIFQSGDVYETHIEQIYTTKDMIITREGATAGLGPTEYTGMQALNYNGTNSGLLVFDSTGTARVGDVGNTQPIATREETPTDQYFVKWDVTANSLVTWDLGLIYTKKHVVSILGLPSYSGAGTIDMLQGSDYSATPPLSGDVTWSIAAILASDLIDRVIAIKVNPNSYNITLQSAGITFLGSVDVAGIVLGLDATGYNLISLWAMSDTEIWVSVLISQA